MSSVHKIQVSEPEWYKAAVAAVFGVAVFLFWWLLHPEWMNYHEQYQLFLFSDSYFLERITVPGGLADYISEFAVQFFYVKWAGALIMAALLMWLSAAGRSIIPALLTVIFMGDQDVLVSFAVALSAALSLSDVFRKAGWNLMWMTPVLWWMIGPLAFIPLFYALITDRKIHDICAAVFTVILIYILHRTVLCQYTPSDVIFGINYHRLPAVLPPLQIIIPAVALLLQILYSIKRRIRHPEAVEAVSAFILMAAAYWGTSISYKKDNYEQLSYDYLIREERWGDVVTRAEKYQPHTEFSASAVNLSLFMTGQLDTRMKEFYQCGTSGLLVPRYRDMLTDMPTTEAYWRLGFVNSTLRYMFDMQEATGNNRKSGRCTKRMIEALIVNGWYEPAEKYICRLEKTLFYRRWAHEARTFLWNEEKTGENRIYSYLRSVRLRNDFLFNYTEMDKMLGQLYLHNRNNIMAAYYYNAYKLLEKEGEE